MKFSGLRKLKAVATAGKIYTGGDYLTKRGF